MTSLTAAASWWRRGDHHGGVRTGHLRRILDADTVAVLDDRNIARGLRGERGGRVKLTAESGEK